MAGVNKVILIGNLTKDPETRFMPSGKSVTNFSIATNESWVDKTSGEKKDKTEYHKLVAFDKLSEIISEHLVKGASIYVEGKLQTRKWQDKSGADKWSTEIIINVMQMLGGKPKQYKDDYKDKKAPVQQETADFDDDNIPF